MMIDSCTKILELVENVKVSRRLSSRTSRNDFARAYNSHSYIGAALLAVKPCLFVFGLSWSDGTCNFRSHPCTVISVPLGLLHCAAPKVGVL